MIQDSILVDMLNSVEQNFHENFKYMSQMNIICKWNVCVDG